MPTLANSPVPKPESRVPPLHKSLFLGGFGKFKDPRGRHVIDLFRGYIQRAIEDRYTILVGDSPGGDLAVQTLLREYQYKSVRVFAKDNVRVNLGGWSVDFHDTDESPLYAMAALCHRAAFFWNCRELSIRPICEHLVKMSKPITVYLSDNLFRSASFEINDLADARAMFEGVAAKLDGRR